MSVRERDPLTGHMLTGHEWNGIKELNTAVPWPVWFFLIATFLFGLGYWLLMPAWPIGTTYTKGLLGINQRTIVTEQVRGAEQGRAAWMNRIATMDYAAIQADPALMRDVRDRGHVLFGDNCAACHGINAGGGPGYPNLTDGKWLWGGTPDAIFNTIRVGINSDHSETHVSQMLAFGREQVLDSKAIESVVAYVMALSRPDIAKARPRAVAAGRAVFAENCSVCHGDDARGNQTVGAPDLTDTTWLYGGDEQSITDTVYGGRQGQMPSWEARISPVDRKILTLYVLDRGAAGR
ncbi:MAG TPA: cytochrome-c oxidase, cbb3-type subunit III [Sphingomonadaceae bacterium]|nr:cytochrome-c oxidase, cbb3-type subunit III [Sphingomonadaceae bacterium]